MIKTLIGEEMQKKLNEVLGACFQMNSHSDNVAYWLDYNFYVEASAEFHEKYAHEFPVLADEISNFMIRMGARPVRYALTENVNDYDNTINAFEQVYNAILNFKRIIQEALDLAEFNNETNCKIFLENFLFNLEKYVHQAEIWKVKAIQIGDDPTKFDKYFDDFTII